MANQGETKTERIERLIREVLEIIPSYTPARGSFSSVPQMGYRARNPGEWQREFLEVLDSGLLHRLKPDTNDIATLTALVNVWTASPGRQPTYKHPDGSRRLIPTLMLSTIVGYGLLEMIVRRLLGTARNDGRVTPYRKTPSVEQLLSRFEDECPIPDLARDLALLNQRMAYHEKGQTRNLYWRLRQGRNALMHGHVLRTVEPEGLLLAPLIGLVVLHIQRDQLQSRQ
jgi:hypothetical protein